MNIRTVMKLNIAVLIITVLFITNQTSAYTTSGGIEEDDVVNLDYTLSYDNNDGKGVVVQQEGPGFETRVSDEVLITGFYEGLLGLKVGDDKKIEVPPEKGYQSGDLAGKTLYFDVYINSIVENVRGDDPDTPTEGIGTFFQTIGNIAMVIGGAVLVYYIYTAMKTRITVPNCAHCNANSRVVKSDGFCKSCGSYYCRDSFAKGCPNCGSNTFMPHK